MEIRKIVTTGLVIGGLLVADKASAFSTSMINFPIADILKSREVLYTFGAAGFAHNVNKGFSWAHTATVGVLDKGELGISNDFLGNTLYDGKVQFYQGNPDGITLSFGVNRYDPNAGTSDTFVSLRKDFKTFRFHASAYKSDKIAGVFGVDFGCGKGCCCGWTAAIEHVTGSNSETWMALNSPCIAKNTTVMLASKLPWDGNSGPQYQIVVNYGFRF